MSTKNQKKKSMPKKAGASAPSKRTAILFATLLFLGAGLGLPAYGAMRMSEEQYVARMKTSVVNPKEYKSFEELSVAMEAFEEEFLNTPVLWTSERGDVTFTPAELGVTSNKDQIQSYLGSFMEQSTPLNRIRVAFFGEPLYYQLNTNTYLLKQPFDTQTQIQQGMKNANYVYRNRTVEIDPEQLGYGVDSVALATEIRFFWKAGEIPNSAAIPLKVREPEHISAELAVHLEQAKALASQSIVFKDSLGESVTLAYKDHMDWFYPLESGDGNPEIPSSYFTVSQESFQNFIDTELTPVMEMEAQSVLISEADGGYQFEGSARMGRVINDAVLYQNFLDALKNGSTEIQVPIDETRPEVRVPDSLRDKGITDLVGVGYSNFGGSPPNRIYNVNRGMEQFNGVIVEPGAEFSFTSLLGPVDGAHGWLPELVIKGNDTIPEYGGGLCQVSSTMFRAALYTGLPITARTNHSYAVRYYAVPFGWGLDATVYDPAPDLRFVNDTASALLIQGYVEGSNAYFVFYGNNDGRTVSMDGPYAYNYNSISDPEIILTEDLAPGERELKEYAHVGFDVDWYRTILNADGTVKTERENFHSSYEARPPKYYEGSLGLPPSPPSS